MADDPPNTSDLSDPVAGDSPREDAETKATREELKQTVISDASDQARASDGGDADVKSPSAEDALKKTPELELPNSTPDSLEAQVSSPRKKRHRESAKDDEQAPEDESSNGHAVVSRTDRAEPEKKRQRDRTPDETAESSASFSVRAHALPSDQGGQLSTAPQTESGGADAKVIPTEKEALGAAAALPSKTQEPPAAPSSAFASSGFAKLSASTSPFGALGGSSKPSIFAASSSAQPSFGFGAAKPAAPTLSFGQGDKSGSASPFASLNGPSTTFGSSPWASGFGGGFGAPKLTSFGKPGEVFKSDKPARPFGHPGSDVEDGDSDSSSSEESDGGEGQESEDKEKEPEEAKTAVDEKKKPKLQRVVVDDGEAGEASVLQVRARLYYLEKDVGWKERGAGILKVNVPERCVDFDEDNNAIAASFDASMLNGDDDDAEAGGASKAKVVRLIMRQDSTHRVILNTAVHASTVFQDRQTLKSASILLTAIEGAPAKPVNIQMKMSVVNAKNFVATMESIQRELREA